MQQDFQIQYMKLKDAVKKMMDAQREYFRSNKDKTKLMIAKGYEKKVVELIEPPVKNERTLFDLEQ